MSLRRQLLLTVTALLALGMGGGALLTFAAVHRHLSQRLDGQLGDIGRQVEKQLAAGTRGSDPAPDDAALAGGLAGLGVVQPSFLQIRGSDGAALRTLSLGPSPPVPAGLRPARTTSSNADGAVFADVAGTGGIHWRVRVAAAPGGRILVVATQRDELDGLLRALAGAEAVVTLGCAAVTALVAVPLIRRAMRPLWTIADTAQAIGDGDLTRRVAATDGGTEVGRVGVALNQMLGRIEEAFGQRAASEERLRQFVADAAHELRTPVTTIRGYAELFGRGAASRPDDLAKAMYRIEAEATRMGALVDELVLLAQLDEGTPGVSEPVDLGALAADAVADARAVEPDRPIALVRTGPARVDGDPARLAQVFGNLLSNVRAHAGSGTAVEVSVCGAGGAVVVAVADRGPGMAAADAARAFERFYRADRSRARSSGGAGLGLAIVASVVAAHGGTATLDSTPGGGTTVTLRLAAAPGRLAEPLGD
jgi:two-component system OmpR family sensor kinase